MRFILMTPTVMTRPERPRYQTFSLAVLGWIAVFSSAAWLGGTVAVAESPDLLDLASGAVVLSQSSEYSESWAALMLLDGTAELGWCSKNKAPFPHEIVIELPGTVAFQSLGFDNRNAQEGSNPGISARQVEIWLSAVSSVMGFKKVAELELPQKDVLDFKMPTGAEGRWLKLVIRSNWGEPSYTELMELSATGRLTPDAEPPPLAGVYRTNYNLMLFEQDGSQVYGCYDHDGGTLTGTTDGRVVQFEWREDQGTQIGTAVMVLSADGETLNGLWYEDGAYRGLWKGPKAESGVRPKCTVRAGKAVEQALKESGHAILYGIHFDVDSDRLRGDSEPVLRQVLASLENLKDLSLIVEGHTDSTGGADHNRDLARRRAASVVRWLVEHGIAAERLEAQGFGADRPVADNATAQGRALNRRVELRRP